MLVTLSCSLPGPAWPCLVNHTFTSLALTGPSGQQASGSLIVDLYITCHKTVGLALAT